MGQSQSNQNGLQQLQRDRSLRPRGQNSAQNPNLERLDDLYRSRSTRSFGDIPKGLGDTVVGAFRRGLRRMRDWLMQKSQPKVEIIELSPMSTAPVTPQGDNSFSIEEAFDAQTLEEPEESKEVTEEPIEARSKSELNLPIHETVPLIEKNNAIELQEVCKKLEFKEEITKKLEYLDFPFLTDFDTIQWIKKNRVIFVMRGLSGSGKSTLVNAISELYDMQDPVICSADHYFIDENGIYRFDPGRLRDAHEASQFLMKNSCEDGKKLIIVDNTHIQAWEMRPYFNNANRASFTYKVIVVEPKTPWKFDPDELSERNTHGLTLEHLQKKIKQFETAVPLYFGWFLSPADSRSIYDRAMILFKNLYESCDVFRENFAEFSSMLNWGSAMNFYSREMVIDKKMVLHCTAKFCGGSFQFKKKCSDINPSLKKYINKVQEKLGTVSRLKIIQWCS